MGILSFTRRKIVKYRISRRAINDEGRARAAREFIRASRKKYGKSLSRDEQTKLARREFKYKSKYGNY